MIFLSVIVICVDILILDKEVICGGVLVFGGMEFKDLNKLIIYICVFILEYLKC